MEKNFDNLTMILDKCKEEMHGAANEDELQRLISDAHNYIDTCNSELEQAKKTIELTNEPVSYTHLRMDTYIYLNFLIPLFSCSKLFYL